MIWKANCGCNGGVMLGEKYGALYGGLFVVAPIQVTLR